MKIEFNHLRAVTLHGIPAAVDIIPSTGPAAVALRARSSLCIEASEQKEMIIKIADEYFETEKLCNL